MIFSKEEQVILYEGFQNEQVLSINEVEIKFIEDQSSNSNNNHFSRYLEDRIRFRTL